MAERLETADRLVGGALGTPPAGAGVGWVLEFESPAVALGSVGGKGANLAELWRAGFPVPPGFCVTTDAYDTFVEAHGLRQRILALTADVAAGDLQGLERVSGEIRGLFAAGRMPEEIEEAIRRAHAELDERSRRAGAPQLAVAVRSSATAEDLPGLSFAGQQDTYLNVLGPDAVCEAVKRCWASLWTARAIGYRARNKIATEEVSIAVVVQQLVPAEVSGVLFTANPVTGLRRETLIDASFGLGEAVVSGQVDPDHYALDPVEMKITSRRLGAKGLRIVASPEGETSTVETDADGRQALPDEQILELAGVAARVEEHFGAPQDIEWAWADGELTLLQARPMTALYPLPEVEGDDGDLHVYLNFSAIQGVIEPLTPLGQQAIFLLGSGAQPESSASLFVSAGGRIFLDVTGPARNPRQRRPMLAVVGRVDPGARLALVELIRAGRLAPKKSAQPRRGGPLRRLGAIRRILGIAWGNRRLVGRFLGGFWNPEKARPRAVANAEAYLARVEERVREASGLAEICASFRADLRGTGRGVYAHLVPLIAPVIFLMSRVDGLLVRWLGVEPGAGLQLMRGLPGNVTVEMDLELWEVAKKIREDAGAREHLLARSTEVLGREYVEGKLPPVAAAALDSFLGEYGMRGVAEIDMGRRRWSEDPTLLLEILQGYLELEDVERSPERAFREGAAAAERLRAEYVRRVRRTRLGLLRARLLDGAIRRLRVLGGLRELPKLHFCKILGNYRAAFLREGAALVERGALSEAGDVFFVPLEDLERFAAGESVDLAAIVAREREAFERESARTRLPRLLLSTGETFYEGLSEESSADLVGAGVSPGVAEGKVRVVLDPKGARLEAGEILVCPSTDPCWTPLFLTAGGLVMEMGGLATHGSVVAREYGLPAVVGVHHATEELRTGQRVRVDGNAGRVTLLE